MKRNIEMKHGVLSVWEKSFGTDYYAKTVYLGKDNSLANAPEGFFTNLEEMLQAAYDMGRDHEAEHRVGLLKQLLTR